MMTRHDSSLTRYFPTISDLIIFEEMIKNLEIFKIEGIKLEMIIRDYKTFHTKSPIATLYSYSDPNQEMKYLTVEDIKNINLILKIHVTNPRFRNFLIEKNENLILIYKNENYKNLKNNYKLNFR